MNRNMAGCAVLATAGQGNTQYATTANQAGAGGLNGIEVFIKFDTGAATDGVSGQNPGVEVSVKPSLAHPTGVSRFSRPYSACGRNRSPKVG
ncbi:MAG: hypothetical protein FJW90_00445 [Actinobacteria bacterium]|nr:hypothetical protein [Actinomycetota bacterium]